MFATMNRIHVNPKSAALFGRRCRERERMVDGMPGFVRNVVLRPGAEGRPDVVRTGHGHSAA
ncbi:MAG: hypothetical protein K8I02_10580 [Candidatus Methylomirabilis sp.]|nr:hypothetical protein [Deltaproteobacteria bacterium]